VKNLYRKNSVLYSKEGVILSREGTGGQNHKLEAPGGEIREGGKQLCMYISSSEYIGSDDTGKNVRKPRNCEAKEFRKLIIHAIAGKPGK